MMMERFKPLRPTLQALTVEDILREMSCAKLEITFPYWTHLDSLERV